MDQKLDQKGKEKKSCLAIHMFVYWFALVIWQNYLTYDKSAQWTTALKMCLVLYLCICFIRRASLIKATSFCCWALFCVSSLISMLFTGETLLGENAVFYLFPSMFSLMALVLCSDYTINHKQFLIFLYLVIAAVAYMSLYSLIFQWRYFSTFFRLRKAYGSELTSFLISNHEYGMYLVFGITSAIICYQSTEDRKLHLLYVVLLALFGINLILTLSRTSYMACAALILVFVLTSKSTGTRKWFLTVIAVLTLLVLILPHGTAFVEQILLKNNDDAGRGAMWTAALEKFSDGTTAERFFGYGNTETMSFTKSTFQHASVHNSFLQVLLIWGIFGFVFLVGVSVYSIVLSVRLFRYDRNLAAVFLALSFAQIAFMFTNTSCLFQSVIDSYMLTVFTLIIPKYVINAHVAGVYDGDRSLQAGEAQIEKV